MNLIFCGICPGGKLVLKLFVQIEFAFCLNLLLVKVWPQIFSANQIHKTYVFAGTLLELIIFVCNFNGFFATSTPGVTQGAFERVDLLFLRNPTSTCMGLEDHRIPISVPRLCLDWRMRSMYSMYGYTVWPRKLKLHMYKHFSRSGQYFKVVQRPQFRGTGWSQIRPPRSSEAEISKMAVFLILKVELH